MYYNSCMVWDSDGKVHDVDIHFSNYTWECRFRALRRTVNRLGIDAKSAYVGGNMWSWNEICSA